MNVRTKKLIGLPVLLLFLLGYIGAVATLAPEGAQGPYRVAEFLFYLIAGVIWALPAGLLIRWMSRA